MIRAFAKGAEINVRVRAENQSFRKWFTHEGSRAMFRGIRVPLVMRAMVALAVVGLALVGTAAARTTKGGAAKACAQMDTVKFGILAAASLSVWTLAQQQGILARECIDGQVVLVATPSTLVAGLVSGEFDVSALNSGQVPGAISQGFPLKAIGVMVGSSADNGVYVKASSSIRTLKDLEGKTIALTALRNSLNAGIIVQLGRAGVDLKKVKFTLIPLAQTLGALQSGQVDAAQVAEPFVTLGGTNIRAMIPDNLKPFGRHSVFGYWLVTTKMTQEKADLVKRIQRAHYKAVRLAAQRPDLVRTAVGTIIPALDKTVLANFRLPYFNPQSDWQEGSLMMQQKYMVKLGFNERVVPVKDIFFKPDLSSPADDILPGRAINDHIAGSAGNDQIFGFQGGDTLDGGPGNDYVDGGPANSNSGNTLLGGAGNDVILAHNGVRDVVDCGAGQDVAYADRKDKLARCEKVVYSAPSAALLFKWAAQNQK